MRMEWLSWMRRMWGRVAMKGCDRYREAEELVYPVALVQQETDAGGNVWSSSHMLPLSDKGSGKAWSVFALSDVF